MKVCKKCCVEHNENEKFCKKCGGILEDVKDSKLQSLVKKKKTIKMKFCEKCNKTYLKEDKFCSNCASELIEKEVEEEELEPEIKEALKQKKKKKRKKIKKIVIIIVILFLGFMYKGCSDSIELEEQQAQENQIYLKQQFLANAQDFVNNVGLAYWEVAVDAAGQQEVFRKNAYGDLNTAVEKYRKDNQKVESIYLSSKKDIIEIYNEDIKGADQELQDDTEVQEICELAENTLNAFNQFVENTVNPTGTYKSYSEESNKRFENTKIAVEDMKTRLKYIIESNGLSEDDIKNIIEENKNDDEA